MIDKLDKWIYRQKYFNCLLGKEYLKLPSRFSTLYVPIIDDILPEPPEINPYLSIETTLHLFDDIANKAKLEEREACAKLCDDNPFVCDDRVGIWLADLIRERSTGE